MVELAATIFVVWFFVCFVIAPILGLLTGIAMRVYFTAATPRHLRPGAAEKAAAKAQAALQMEAWRNTKQPLRTARRLR